MSDKITIKPAPGLQVRHPDGRKLKADGEPVQLTTYWRRALAAGDVVEVKPDSTTAAARPPRRDQNPAKPATTNREE